MLCSVQPPSTAYCIDLELFVVLLSFLLLCVHSCRLLSSCLRKIWLFFLSTKWGTLQLYAEVWKGTPGVWAYWSSGNYKVSDDTDWIFYASTFDNSTKLVNIYINGVLINSVTETDPKVKSILLCKK